MEGFPSGQRGQTVNLLAQPSEVQILPPPPCKVEMVAGTIKRGNSSVGRASAFQAERRGFESRFPLHDIQGAIKDRYLAPLCWLRPVDQDPQGLNDLRMAHVAQSVEHFLGKEEVHRFDPGRGLHLITRS